MSLIFIVPEVWDQMSTRLVDIRKVAATIGMDQMSTRLIDIRKVAATIGIEICSTLNGLHAYTGCDTVSASAGKSKTTALKLLTSNKETQDTFLELGQEWDLSPELMDKLEAFTCLLYASKASTTKVNELRYHLFYAKKGEIESHQL